MNANKLRKPRFEYTIPPLPDVYNDEINRLMTHAYILGELHRRVASWVSEAERPATHPAIERERIHQSEFVRRQELIEEAISKHGLDHLLPSSFKRK